MSTVKYSYIHPDAIIEKGHKRYCMVNTETTIEKLAINTVHKRICPSYFIGEDIKFGLYRRAKSNKHIPSMIFMDFDGERNEEHVNFIPLQKAIELFSKLKSPVIITTSQNHNKIKNDIKCHRYHAHIPLDIPLLDQLLYKECLFEICTILGLTYQNEDGCESIALADPACFDSVRYFNMGKKTRLINNDKPLFHWKSKTEQEEELDTIKSIDKMEYQEASKRKPLTEDQLTTERIYKTKSWDTWKDCLSAKGKRHYAICSLTGTMKVMGYSQTDCLSFLLAHIPTHTNTEREGIFKTVDYYFNQYR